MTTIKNILKGIKYALDKKADKKIVNNKFEEVNNRIEEIGEHIGENNFTPEDALDLLFSSELIIPAVIDINIMTNDEGDILIL